MNGFRKKPKKYIIAVDVGTTTVKACLYDDKCALVNFAERPINLDLTYEDDEGMHAEIDPELLWEAFCAVCKLIFSQVEDVNSIASMGISCQRSTFICWDSDTGKPCHKLVTWKDCRARQQCERWNRSWTIMAMNALGRVLYFFTRSYRFKSMIYFRFLSGMATHRVMVTISESAEMQRLLEADKLRFGCLDGWLIHKLTKGQVHVTEPSSASATGLFDPFTMDWGHIILRLISFPTSILPPLTYTAGIPLATCDRGIFGFSFSIGSVAGDQQSALFASGCLNKGDVSMCMGTGSFMELNTGDYRVASLKGVYPLVGWKLPDMQSFVAEGCTHDTALLLKWAQSIGLFEDVSQTAAIAKQTSRSDLCFVPAFGGLQTPINDSTACCAFLGLRADTTKEHMLRAVLEAIAFGMYQVWNTILNDIPFELGAVVSCCGGVSNNDFVCETISTLINRPLKRIAESKFASAKGVAMMAGLTMGLWKQSDLDSMVHIDKVFQPSVRERAALLSAFEHWQSNLTRCLHYYKH